MAMGSDDARKNAESPQICGCGTTSCDSVPMFHMTTAHSSHTIDVMRRIPRTGFCCGQDMGMMVAMDGGGMMMARMLAN
jgi:hypothetical protein